jgi:hypothetical protein
LLSRRISAGIAGLGIYFGAILIPEWWPGFAGSPSFFLYVLSIPITLLALLGIAVWGVIGAFAARRRGSSMSSRHRGLVVLGVAGFLIFGLAVVLARQVKGALPTGSHLLEFAPSVWRDPKSSRFIDGDITPRQKMLGSVVERLGPTQSGADIEALLGPSLETPYFESTGRDLIYILGPQRDSLFAIDSEWLLIWLDDSGHFERYDIYTD